MQHALLHPRDLRGADEVTRRIGERHVSGDHVGSLDDLIDRRGFHVEAGSRARR